ncbi:hypothetical protein PIROE2DRAFT_4588 [Piromyces sp. E2]|nr:hypothetical protein PIROE2DRAFT_4588 [Piromyces sp. E2]|eukprot:OUM67908.1 hypothetical protein PIROE2DRAFT_4588 [Piromyces sp. E2]
MENNTEQEVTIINNSFYPERIIFCIDISGEMNQHLEIADLPYPTINNKNENGDFQSQTLSVPSSPIDTPTGSPKVSYKSNYQDPFFTEPMNVNVATASSTSHYPTSNMNNDYNLAGNNVAATSSRTSSNNINNAYGSMDSNMNNLNGYNNNNDFYSNSTLEKSGSIKGLANSAKRLLSKGRGDDNNMSDSSRSSSPIKNILKNNNENSASASPESSNRRSSLNFLKSSYSNVVQNVFSSNHSRASSNTSTGSFGSLNNTALSNKDFPSLKTPIELSRLEIVKRYIKRFVSLKGSLSKDHQYAIVLLGVDAIWYNDFTSDYKNIINVLEEIPSQGERIKEFDMESLLNLIKERSLIPNVLTSSHFLRVIFLYSRPTIPVIDINSVILKQLQDSKLFMFDCVYFHDKKSDNNDPQVNKNKE